MFADAMYRFRAIFPERSCIIVVNDDPEIVELYRLILEQQGYAVIGVYNSYDALTILNEINPDLIITNIARSPMDGWEFITNCKKNPLTKDIPVIVASAQTYTPEKQHKYGNYIEEYIQLVFTSDLLIDTIKKVLEKRNGIFQK
jgi:CheY-like chemotaxis protein